MSTSPRPALKAVYTPIDVATDTVSLGFPRTPLSATVADPDGWVRALLHTLDGRWSLAQVVERFAGSLSAADIHALVDTLARGGFLEDAGAPPPAALADAELDRYERNAEFFSYFTDRTEDGFASGGAPTRWSPQVALKNASVAVVGLGGFGSHVAMHLAALGVGHLLLVDDDVVETANLARQPLYRDADVGRAKVDAAATRLRETNPAVDVATSRSRVASAADAETWLRSADLTVCAADRPRVEIDHWFNRAALRCGRPWLRGASIGLSAALDLFVPGRTSCAECRLHPGDDGDDSNAVMAEQLRVGGPRGTSPSISPVAGLLGSLGALEVTKFLTGVTPTVLLDHQLVVDVVTSEIHHLPDPRVPGCPGCGGA